MSNLPPQKLYEVASDPAFQGAVLIATLDYAHELMNTPDADPKLRIKAWDVINNPEQYKERLALNAITRLSRGQMKLDKEGHLLGEIKLKEAVVDLFDALAGVGLNT